MNISRNTWIDTNIREALVGSLAGLLNNANPQILRETVEALDSTFSLPKGPPASALLPASCCSTTARLKHVFEAAGGLDSLEALLTSSHLTSHAEAEVEQLLTKHFPSTQVTSMELDDNEIEDKENLLLVFADTVNENGRLW